MKKIALVAVAAVALGVAGTAQAGSLGRPCTTEPQNKWLSVRQLQAKVEAQGFTVKKAKIKKACGELYVLDKNGAKVELFVDPTNGKIVGRL